MLLDILVMVKISTKLVLGSKSKLSIILLKSVYVSYDFDTVIHKIKLFIKKLENNISSNVKLSKLWFILLIFMFSLY